MSFVDRFYMQQITYWGIVSRDAFGKITFAAPVIFKGRWENKLTEVLSTRGETLVCKSIIHYPDDISPDVIVDGYLYEGFSEVADPLTLPNAFRIQSLTNMPDLRSLTNVNIALV